MTKKERKILEDAGLIYPTIVTNADRVRSMSDKDLAEWLANEKDCSWNDGFCGSEGASKNDLLSWLKSPVEVDNG